MIMRGLSIFLGGYPDENKIFDELIEGKFKLSYVFSGYIAVFIFFNAAGWIVQHKCDPRLQP
jgi:hypothetical protein